MRFEDLEVWKRVARLSADIYRHLKDLKDFGFKDQITRSGLSVPSNIAEGFERLSEKEGIAFLSYAKGSAGELRCQIYTGMDIGYIPKNIGSSWIKRTIELSAMIGRLIKTKNSTWRTASKSVTVRSSLNYYRLGNAKCCKYLSFPPSFFVPYTSHLEPLTFKLYPGISYVRHRRYH